MITMIYAMCFSQSLGFITVSRICFHHQPGEWGRADTKRGSNSGYRADGNFISTHYFSEYASLKVASR